MKSTWQTIAVKDLGRVVTGRTPSSNNPEHFGNGYPFITPSDISLDNRHIETERHVSEEGKESLERILLPQGAICFVCIGATIGKICVTSRPSFTNQQINSVIVDESKHDSRFAFYALSLQGGNAKALAGGAATPIINKSAFSEIEIEVPSLPTQRHIAGILSAYDDLIENNLRRIKILEQMAQSLYREWFVHFRFPGHAVVKMVDSTMGEIPQGWEVKKLEQILELKYGKALKKEDRREGQYPVFGSSGIVGTHDISLTNGPGIVVGRKGNVGSVFWSDEDFFVIDTAYFVESSLPLRFLFYLLPTLNFINSDAAVPGLSRQQAYSLQTIVPPADLLSKFCTLADSFERQASTHRRQNQNLRRTRDLLLPKLLMSND